MHLTIVPKNRYSTGGYLQIDDATLAFRNFEGRGDRYNREGDRNFSVRIFDQEVADALLADVSEQGVAWNVKIKAPREEGEAPYMHLPVKVRFNGRGPKVVLITNGNQRELDEESIACLDRIAIEKVDLDVRSYDDEANGRPFRAAYLDKMYVTQRVDRFVERYDV